MMEKQAIKVAVVGLEVLGLGYSAFWQIGVTSPCIDTFGMDGPCTRVVRG